MPIEVVSLETLRTAVSNHTDIVVLCGAGISMIAPTSLPSGDELRDMCVTGLLTDQISDGYLQQIVATPAYQKLLPEIAFQEIATTCEKQLDEAMRRILGATRHNQVQEHLARAYRDIFTTNFDLCLEKCGAESVSHLHGTIAVPSSIQNRIYRLGKTAEEEFDRFRRTAGRPVLVLGYSFRDKDVLELVAETKPSSIYYLSYDGTVPVTVEQLGLPCVLAKGSAEELFKLEPTQFDRPASPYPDLHIRKPSRAARAHALLRLCFIIGRYDLGEEITRLYLPFLHGRARLKSLAELANLYRVKNEFDRSSELAREILAQRSVRQPSNADVRSSAHVHLGLCDLDRELGNFEEIEQNFLAALNDIREFTATEKGQKWKTEIEIWTARIYNNLGITYSEWGRFGEAIKYYRRSCRIKRSHHEEVGVANTLSNITKLYIRVCDYERAALVLGQVLSIMKRLPDPYVLTDTLAAIPDFLQRSRGIRLDASTGSIIETSTNPPLERAELLRINEIANILAELSSLRSLIQ